MKIAGFFILTLLIPFLFFSCKEQNSKQKEIKLSIVVKTTHFKKGTIEKYIRLNGKTVFLKKNRIIAPISAFLKKATIRYGDKVKKNEVLFELQTKESKSLNNHLGEIKIVAPVNGTIVDLPVNLEGGYITEGQQLCSIAENNDLMIQVNVPYEDNRIIKKGTTGKIFLPDHTMIEGKITKILPLVNQTNQTQVVLIKPITIRQLPEHLNLIVRFVAEKHLHSYLIEKRAVMTNETESVFWVMKIIDDSLAIKIPVNIGIENDSLVEILSPDFKIKDDIITEGAYGLPDSTVVRIVK